MWLLTGVDEELVGHPWVVHIMDGTCKQSSHDLKVSEDRLEVNRQKHLLSEGYKH